MAQTGREPALSGADFGGATGQEPMLGGELQIKLLRAYYLEQIKSPRYSHNRRLDAGLWLQELRDTRPGVGLNADGLPDLDWVAVRGGVADIHDRLGRDEMVPVRRFWLARYPVTWNQYRPFLEDPYGHADPRWWEGLRRRDEYERTAPPIGNQPVQEVSWYDAIAYCRWLTARSGVQVRLPTEAEWQQAANAGEPENVFPWGQRWEGHRANTRESKLRQVTAVGMYPQGESPFGILDMCGTVQEWCQNLYEDVTHTTHEGAGPRVTRGGSWFTVKEYATTVFRTGSDPYHRYHSVGFRLACDDPTDLLPVEPLGAVEETDDAEAASDPDHPPAPAPTAENREPRFQQGDRGGCEQ